MVGDSLVMDLFSSLAKLKKFKCGGGRPGLQRKCGARKWPRGACILANDTRPTSFTFDICGAGEVKGERGGARSSRITYIRHDYIHGRFGKDATSMCGECGFTWPAK